PRPATARAPARDRRGGLVNQHPVGRGSLLVRVVARSLLCALAALPICPIWGSAMTAEAATDLGTKGAKNGPKRTAPAERLVRIDTKLIKFCERLTNLPAHLASSDPARQLCEEFEALADRRNALRRAMREEPAA